MATSEQRRAQRERIESEAAENGHAPVEAPALDLDSVVRLPQALGERIDIAPTVESLRPLIEASEQQMERDRELPPDLAEALYQAGIMQTNHPREFGGVELHPLDYLDLLFELARINGSVAWIGVIQNGVTPLLAPELMREMQDRAGGRLIFAGSHGRIGEAVPVAGGYRFTGDWAFASGAPWATYITALAHVIGEDREKLLDPAGRPIRADGIFAKEEVDYVGGWSSLGLRGTGSGDFSLRDVFKERHWINSGTHEAYLDRALFRAAPNGTPVVALGCAQGAIDRFIQLSQAKRRTNSWGNRANGLGAEQNHQVRIAHADAIVRSAMAWLRSHWQRSYDSAFSKDAQLLYDLMAEGAEADIYGGRAAKAAVNLVFDIAGTDAVIEGRGIERCFRDVHTATQHSLMLENRYMGPGQNLLTRDLPDGPIITAPNAMLPPVPRTGAAARIWKLDALHSTVGFRVTDKASGSFRAQFGEFEATYDPDLGVLCGSAKTASVRTFDALKDVLLGPDYLDAASHPQIEFAASDVAVAEVEVTIQGDLTLRGITRTVRATGMLTGPSRDRGFGADQEYIGLDVTLTIDRREFGMTTNKELLDGQLNLGWNVALEFALEFSRPVQAD